MGALDLGESVQGRVELANPVFDGYFADPFVFFAEGRYHAVGTGPCPPSETAVAFPMLVSDDLTDWQPIGGALLRVRAGDYHYWAPEIAYADGVYWMFFSVGTSDERHELRVARSRRPNGPYVEQASPILDPATAPFAIDPNPFRDVDGTWYLYYARDFFDSDRPGTALVVAPLSDMRTLEPGFRVVMRARHDWQRYEANRPIHGGSYDWHTLEGPCTLSHEGRYYCFYSGGNWQNDTYGVDYLVADSPLGPWLDTNPGDGPRVLRTIPGRLIGPGHNSAFTDHDGQHWIAYHAWDAGMTARRLCLDRLVWTADGPRVCVRS